MVIAVNIRALSGNSAISKLLIDYFEIIAADHPADEFIFIGEKEFSKKDSTSKNITRIIIHQRAGNPLLWKLWYNYKLPAALKKYKAAVLINADGACSLRIKVPQCMVVADLAVHDHPEWYTKKYHRFITTNTPAFLQKAKRIITFSTALKDRIKQQYKIEGEKISVIQLSTDEKYQPADDETREQVKKQYADGKEYFLFSGAIHPRSNLINLLKGFSLFKKRQKSNMQLIIASEAVSEDNAFMESIKLYKYRNEIRLLENADENSLRSLTASAYACINLSPLHTDIARLLNALQCSVPVVAGNLYAAIELLEDAALYVTANAPEHIAESLMLLYKDENKRNGMVKKGLLLSQRFTSKPGAEDLWQIIRATIQQQ